MCSPPLVVILEDDDVAADGLSLILKDWGAEVLRAELTAPIQEQFVDRAEDISCIITDFHLGDGPDGVALTEQLLERAPSARVLVLSGSFRGHALQSAAAAGFETMQKPARAESIFEWLDRD